MSATYCSSCGKPIPDGARFCPSCGQPRAQEGLSTSAPSADSSSTVHSNTSAGSRNTQSSQASSADSYPNSRDFVRGGSNATIGLVCGIISVAFPILLPMLPFCAIIALVLGVIAVYQANVAKSCGTVGGMQTAGFVLGIIGICLSGLTLFSCVACASLAVGGAGALGSYMSSLGY